MLNESNNLGGFNDLYMLKGFVVCFKFYLFPDYE